MQFRRNKVSSLSLLPGKMCGEIHVPPSKSDTQRALICAALASGDSLLENVGTSEDERAMLQLIQDLGRTIEQRGNQLSISGKLNIDHPIELHVGESGLTTRLITGVSASFNIPITLKGKGSILKRSMNFWMETLPKFGVKVESQNNLLPLTIKGPFKVYQAQVDGSQSSQTISGLLLGLAHLGKGCHLQVNNLVSQPYLLMTLHTMSCFGVNVYVDGNNYSIENRSAFKASHYTIESDWSSAAFWVVAAALGHKIILGGLNPTSLQADREIIKIVELAGGHVEWKDDKLHVSKKKDLKGFEADLTHCPDLFPIVALLASQCSGKTTLTGVHRLADKESDRSKAIQEEFAKMGVNIAVSGDQMEIIGPCTLNSAQVDAHHDHRIAMMLAISATISTGIVDLSGFDSVAKSYPQFWIHYQGLKS